MEEYIQYAPVLQACELALSKSKSKTDNHILPAFYQTLEGLITTVLIKVPLLFAFEPLGATYKKWQAELVDGICTRWRKVDIPNILGKHTDFQFD
jgi:hypothetical protein